MDDVEGDNNDDQVEGDAIGDAGGDIFLDLSGGSIKLGMDDVEEDDIY